MQFAKVIIDIKHTNIDQSYDYIIPFNLIEDIEVGMRVYVPFGSQNRIGYVIKILDESTAATKEIIELIDEKSVINDELIKMKEHMMKYPGANEAGVFETIIASSLFYQYEKEIILKDINLIEDEIIKDKFNKKGTWKINKKEYKTFYNTLKRLEKKAAITIITKLKKRSKAKKQLAITLGNNKDYKMTERQLEVYELVSSRNMMLLTELKDYCSISVIDTLVKWDVLSKVEVEISRINPNFVNKKAKPLEDVKELEPILKIVNNNNNKNINTFSVTISDFNFRIMFLIDQIKETMAKSKTTLLLVPEIVLITPLINEIMKYFTNINIVTYHSELSKGSQYDSYYKIVNESESIHLIIGTRSTVFIPIKNIGNIIVFDSHNENFIDNKKTYFDTLEIASIKRAFYDTKLIYLSYVQPLRIYHKSNKEIIKLNLDNNEANKEVITLVDMREEIKMGNYKIFSNKLTEKINKALKNKQQVMLLMNLKGYASFVMCRNCGHIVKDKLNDLPMIYYKQGNKLKARHNKEERDFTNTCEICQTNMLRPVSAGVEQLYSHTKQLFKDAKVLYLEQSKYNKTSDYLNKIDEFSNGNYDIIVGTSFINKSYNAKNITVIGILMIDQMLNLPYYDAYEKTYQYLMQTTQHDFSNKVDVVVQTYNIDNKILKFFSQGDSKNYYLDQLKTRKFAKLPPVNNMVQLIFKSNSYFTTYQKAFEFKKIVSEMNVEVLGPLASYLLKENGLYRFILTIKYKNWTKELSEVLEQFRNKIEIVVSSNNEI